TPTPSQRAMLGQPTRVGAEAPLAESQLRAVRRGPGAYLVLGAMLLAAGGVGGYLVMGNKKSSDVIVPEPEGKPVPAVPVAVEPPEKPPPPPEQPAPQRPVETPEPPPSKPKPAPVKPAASPKPPATHPTASAKEPTAELRC